MPRPKLPIAKQKARFCVSVPRPLADRMDRIFTNRSAAIVQAVTHYLDNLDNLDDIDLIRAEQAEIARLRKVLEEIAAIEADSHNVRGALGEARDIARRALEVKG